MSTPDVQAAVLARIDPEALARDCLDFVAVPSETGTEGPGAAFLADLLRRPGWEVSLDEAAPGRPNVAARLPSRGGMERRGGDSHPSPGRSLAAPLPDSVAALPRVGRGPRRSLDPGGGPEESRLVGQGGAMGRGPALLLNGHVDTIPIGRAWPPRRDGEWIYGRGAEDMKAGLVAMVHAARAVAEAGVPLGRDVWLTGVVGHETPTGKKEGPLRLIERIRTGALPAGAILVCEGPAAIWRASLGSAIFDLTLAARRPPTHTSRVPYRENPVRALAPLLAELDGLDARLRDGPAHPLAGPGQLNVGIVAAGDYPNRLPVRLRLTGTRRWTPQQTAPAVQAELEALARRAVARSGLDLEVEVALEAVREPFETPAGDPLVGALRRAGERLDGHPPPEVGLALVGDASLYAGALGLPAVYYGPSYETAHSDAERVAVAQVVRCARIYALTILEYCAP